jgi:hypothetical protein
MKESKPPNARQPRDLDNPAAANTQQLVEEHPHSNRNCVKVKNKAVPGLLILRGLLIEEYLHVSCPICGQVHSHSYSGAGGEKVVDVGCENQPYVKHYRIAPIKKKDLARMEASAAGAGINLPLTKLVSPAKKGASEDANS